MGSLFELPSDILQSISIPMYTRTRPATNTATFLYRSFADLIHLLPRIYLCSKAVAESPFPWLSCSQCTIVSYFNETLSNATADKIPFASARRLLRFFPPLSALSVHFSHPQKNRSEELYSTILLESLQAISGKAHRLLRLTFSSAYYALPFGSDIQQHLYLVLSSFTSLVEMNLCQVLQSTFRPILSSLPRLKRYVCSFPSSASRGLWSQDPLKTLNWAIGPLRPVEDEVRSSNPPRDAAFRLSCLWISDVEGIKIGSRLVSELTSLHATSYFAQTPETINNLVSALSVAGGSSACNIRWPGPNSFNLTPFQAAVSSGRVAVVKVLLDTFDPDLTVKCFDNVITGGLDAFELAVITQKAEVAETLLSMRVAFYISAYSPDQILRLFSLAQMFQSGLRDDLFQHKAKPEEITRTVEVLLKFFGSKFSLASLRHSITKKNLLHSVFDGSVVKLLISKGVSLTDRDELNQTPWMANLHAATMRCGPFNALAVLFESEFKSGVPAEPPENVGLLVRGLTLLRQHLPDYASREPLVELEKFCWENVSREALEETYLGASYIGGAPWWRDIISNLHGYLSSKYPYVEWLKAKKFRFGPLHNYLVDRWVERAVAGSRTNLYLSEYERKESKVECAKRALMVVSSFRHRTEPGNHPPMFRSDALADLVRYLYKDKLNTDEGVVSLELAHEMVFVSRECGHIRALALATQFMPDHRAGLSEPLIELHDKIFSAHAALAPDDDDLSEDLNFLVRLPIVF